MWPKLAQLSTVALLLASVGAYEVDHEDYERLSRRFAIDGGVAESYDYIIVGGGQSGLAVASRLTEDSSVSVLVIEAGDNGDSIRAKIDTPSSTYFDSITGTQWDWQYATTPEANTGNRVIYWPRGKVLGGSSAMNAMFMVRPSQIEVDAMAKMVENTGAGDSKKWNWDALYAAMKKSETFTPPPEDAARVAKIQFDANSHGTDGPIHTSYSPFAFTFYAQYLEAAASIGIANNPDPMSGKNWGAWTTGTFVNPSNLTRSYSRSGYIDSLPQRPNLNIITNNTVTRVLFRDNTATGVEYANHKDAEKKSVQAKREVILSAGSIATPQILQVSGVGPKSVLDAAGVHVVADLPGVGQHLQDHLTNSVAWNTSVDTAGSLYKTGLRSKEFLSHLNSGVAYLNASLLFPDVAAFQKQVKDQYEASLSNAVLSQDPAVVAGYKARYDTIADTLIPSQTGLVELIMSEMAQDGTISIGVALQHPLSQGRIYINSSSIFDRPLIEPNYLAHPADIVMLREGLKVVRKLGGTAPWNGTVAQVEVYPGPAVQSDEDWDKWIRQNTWTQFHPACTAVMLPKSQGGVIDANLNVYGTRKLRVVDGSIFPFLFAAHNGAPTYGAAEAGAAIIATTKPNSASLTIPVVSWTLFAAMGVLFAI